MRSFGEFGIKIENNGFVGDKVKISKILNREIIVHTFKIDDSKFNTGKCLCIQIELNSTKHVVFTGSTMLAEAIKQVPKEGFPFKTTIVSENDMYVFT